MGMQDFKTEEARSTRINVLWVYVYRFLMIEYLLEIHKLCKITIYFRNCKAIYIIIGINKPAP